MPLAVVVAKRLLIQVTKEVEGLNRNVGAVHVALEQAPEVFEAIGMNPTIHIFDSMVYDLMGVLPCKTLVGEEKVGVQRRSRLNMLLHLGLQRMLLAVRYNRGDDLAAALEDAHHGDLVLGPGASDTTGFLRNVHVASLAADESLVRLDLASELDGGILMHDLTDAMQYEPSRLLGNSDAAVHLVARDAVLASTDHPNSHHPLIEAKGRILENGSDLEAELLLAPVAHPDTARLDKGVLLRPATGASYLAVWKAKIERVLESTVRIAEVNNGFLQCVRGFHDLILDRIDRCVKYIIALVLCERRPSSSAGVRKKWCGYLLILCKHVFHTGLIGRERFSKVATVNSAVKMLMSFKQVSGHQERVIQLTQG